MPNGEPPEDKNNKKGFGNKRVLDDIKINKEKVSMDLERGGSGKNNIHLKVGNKKYFLDKKTGKFYDKNGIKAPKSITKNSAVKRALDKALRLENKGW